MNITAKDKINIDRDFKVEAGPGAGKTEFLVNHIRNVLHNSQSLSAARRVACITYTNIAVHTICKRLGRAASDRVDISTIHGFLYRNIVKPYGSFIPKEYEVCCQKVNGHEAFEVRRRDIREWFKTEDLSELKHPNTERQLLMLPAMHEALVSWLSSMRCVYKSGKVFFECDNKKAVFYESGHKTPTVISNRNLRILSDKLIGLKQVNWRKGQLDHEDILFFSAVLMKEYPFILTVLCAKYPYVFIDEYQDTNPIQAFILDELRKKDVVVGVIGDKAQSIYQFQGADPAFFDLFQVAEADTHTIHDNYRSTNQIVDFLNYIRSDIRQVSQTNENSTAPILFIGSKRAAYARACQYCPEGKVISLSRDNITSNAMKKEMDGIHLNKQQLLQYRHRDNNSERKQCMLSFIRAAELAVNGSYKQAVRHLQLFFGKEENPQKAALRALLGMLRSYNAYCDGSMMQFYDTVLSVTGVKISGFRKGGVKDFYDEVRYRDLALCIDIADDSTNHITIHKAKGTEYENVLVIGNRMLTGFLLNPDLHSQEEHRILYVAVSRAKRQLFLLLEELDASDEGKIRNKYENMGIERL